MRTTVSSRGQIVLPAELRRMDRVQPDRRSTWSVSIVALIRRAAPPNEGAVDWLLACPHKDFFVPIDF
jgi:hypothetical protein